MTKGDDIVVEVVDSARAKFKAEKGSFIRRELEQVQGITRCNYTILNGTQWRLRG